MTYQFIPKIGLIGPEQQCIDLALDLAMNLASDSKYLVRKNIYLEEMMDFYPIKTPVWNNGILAIEFKNLDRFKIQKVPSPNYALSLSRQFREVLMSLELEDEEGLDVFNIIDGELITGVDDIDDLINELMEYWDIELRDLGAIQNQGN